MFLSLDKTSKKPCKVKITKLQVGKRIPVYVTYATNSQDFFCQTTGSSIQLDDLMNKIEEHYRPLNESDEKYSEPQVLLQYQQFFTQNVATKCLTQLLFFLYVDR